MYTIFTDLTLAAKTYPGIALMDHRQNRHGGSWKKWSAGLRDDLADDQEQSEEGGWFN